ncbi:uncharacterized protein LOC133193588 [Saccostrea echinata]|uniref:uncharacterized protein LOC133193588 n=1 Tax=Saccostrea echinata TaxID=191078 RepID=UPI002A81862B|nr:uncharacterized protein LOC133193588 [Saccostrea echinata]
MEIYYGSLIGKESEKVLQFLLRRSVPSIIVKTIIFQLLSECSRKLDGSSKKTEAPVKESSLPESSQTVHGRLEQERLTHRLQRACSPNQDLNNLEEMMDTQFSDVQEKEKLIPQLPENEPVRRLFPAREPAVAFRKQSDQTVPSPVNLEEEKALERQNRPHPSSCCHAYLKKKEMTTEF